jgi:hypothetical protein
MRTGALKDDERQRFSRLAEIAFLELELLPQGVGDDEADAVGNAIGPPMAALSAASICAEMLARLAGVDRREVEDARRSRFDPQPVEFPNSASESLRVLLALQQHVANVLIPLAVWKPSPAKGER